LDPFALDTGELHRRLGGQLLPKQGSRLSDLLDDLLRIPRLQNESLDLVVVALVIELAERVGGKPGIVQLNGHRSLLIGPGAFS
jgi:hypothetical protein